MRNLSRLILKMDEALTDITLVFDGGVFSIYRDDKKSKDYSEKEIKSILSSMKVTALDLPSSIKQDIDKIISQAKSSTGKQIDLSADSGEVDKLRLS
jgi:DNA-directed RNA polymerase subunit H (RpoH/RPB5)